ncbi:MAG: PLP-dependent aminotransferase family protein [Candidatus Eremiobacteraeota bacterium]|nr:PLP-dependent aminotransferase family protein [Candidatus Eremiobacteraeota bacterium]MBC5802363.1 PLP-dependent aminotransferase family protein [Candidatus Eremiobacteraeota bacterium]MBC5820581.1 PLP-dependent aminotransferase family protein [Candidatus Eremiobacteraeota bacterium]
MRIAPFDLQVVGVALDPQSATPKHRQLYSRLREAVLGDRLHAGDALPSSRTFARELGVSRNTVLAAYEQLLAEGYLVGRAGSGTFVAADATRERSPKAPSEASPGASQRGHAALAPAAALLSALRMELPYPLAAPRAFQIAATPIDVFPFAPWARLAARRLRDAPGALLSEREPLGYRPLREAIAAHLRNTRAVLCEADQIAVVSGAHAAIFMCAMLLVGPHDAVWMEEPGYPAARGALRLRTEHVVPVPVDAEGLDVATGLQLAPRPRLIYATPSHQFPLGATMTLRRRLDLLHAAESANAWIIEDDYDSELRYDGRPLAALQGLDRSGRVIYVGTFNKIVFQGLRIGYAVLPRELVDSFTSARYFIDEYPPALAQAVLTDFMDEGFFARYVRKARPVCAERQDCLLARVRHKLGDLVRLEPSPAGGFLVAELPDDVDDVALSFALGRRGVDVLALSPFFAGAAVRRGLLLGYAAVDLAAIRAGVDTLARVASDFGSPT